MFDVAPTELLLVAVVALVVIGPKDLPRVMRVVGGWVGQARRMAGHFKSGLDEMVRQAELEEFERKWADENARIMREHPGAGDDGDGAGGATQPGMAEPATIAAAGEAPEAARPAP